MSETAEAEVKKEVIEVTETVETSAPQEEVKPPLSPNDKEEPTSNLPDRPRSTSPTKPGQGTGEKRKRSRSRHRGGRGRRRLSPGPRGPRRPSPGPPPLPPPGPPPPGFRRMPDRVDSPSSPLRRGRSPEPPRRRSPPPLPPPIPPPSSYGRSRYSSPPRRSPPRRSSPPRRRSRSRSPRPRSYRSPPPSMRRRRSPIRSPPRRRSPPGSYRRSRSPPYRRRSPPYSPRGPSPSRRRSPIRSRPRTRSPSPPRHRLPSPNRPGLRRPLASPPRSGQGSRRVSPLGHRRSPPPLRKRTRSPEKGGETQSKEEDDRLSKKRRTLDGSEARDTEMRDAKRESEEPTNASHLSERKLAGLPPTEPRSVRELREAGKIKERSDSPALKLKTEIQDVEMVDRTASMDSPKVSTPSAPRSMLAKSGASAKPAPAPSATPVTSHPPPVTPAITIPTMRPWKKDSVTPDLDAEIERIRQLRLQSMAEHINIATSVRKAFYELEMAKYDLRVSEAKLAVAEKQTQLAAKGELVYVEEH